jgi:hypothetical protein
MKSLLTKSVLGFGLVILLSSCSSLQQVLPVEVSTRPVDKPELTLPRVDELRMREVNWIVINQDNVDQVFEDLKNKNIPVGVYALTGEQYENLGLNFSDIRALVQQQQAIIVAYEKYYKEAEQTLDKAVTVED